MTEHTEGTLTAAILQTWTFTSGRPRYIVGIQVNNGAGFAYNRTLDAVVFDTWPSSGLSLHGLEIKTNRADLRRELMNTKKFADFAKHLDHFSIVAPLGVAKLEMLPERWGLYYPEENSGKLRARRKPLMLHDQGGRKEMTRSLAAAFMRALVARSIDAEAQAAEYDRGYANGLAEGKNKSKRAVVAKEQLQGAIDKFEEASGVRISTYNGTRIGEAVDFIMRGGLEERVRFAPDIRELGTKLIDLADQLEAISGRLKMEQGSQ